MQTFDATCYLGQGLPTRLGLKQHVESRILGCLKPQDPLTVQPATFVWHMEKLMPGEGVGLAQGQWQLKGWSPDLLLRHDPGHFSFLCTVTVQPSGVTLLGVVWSLEKS